MLCASPDYLHRHGTPQAPADLSSHNCLLYAYAPAPLDWVLVGRDGGEVSVRVSGTMTANNGHALTAAAIAGQGIVRQPTFIVGHALRAGELVEILPEYGMHFPTAYASTRTPATCRQRCAASSISWRVFPGNAVVGYRAAWNRLRQN